MVLYPNAVENKIGFDAVRRMVSQRCLSSLGIALSQEIEPCDDYDKILLQLQKVDEMQKIINNDEDFPLNAIHDLIPTLQSIRVPGTHVPEQELPTLRSSLSTISAISAFFVHHRSDEGGTPYPALDALAAAIGNFSDVVAAIDRIADKLGGIKDSASPELASIRSALSSMQGTINNTLRRVIAAAVKEGYLEADVTPSLRDGRPVIPVAPMNKRKIPGIVHDESASGKTFFIEPAEVVQASNRLRELQMDERREVLRILTDLATSLRPRLPELIAGYSILGEFDFVHAKAMLAFDTGANMPHLHRDMQLELYHACHPVLKAALAKQGKEIVPLDVRLTPEQRILIISGPNAGGKSVTLKTVAICQYMLQCGLLPPVYENSHMGIVQGIFIDIGDDQSMENELSTYSSHLRNMKYILANADSRSLVLIDEFGGGTEPQIGGAIAQAVLQQFVQIGLWGIITTHFQNLKKLAGELPGLVNGSMLYDRHLMQPLFRLAMGSPGSSFAVEIARKIGLPESIIKEAESIVGSDYINMDKYLLDIARDRRYWENKRLQIKQKEKKIEQLIEKYEDDAETLRTKRREIIDEARSQARQILEGSNAAIERAIHDIRQSQAEKERTMAARQQLEQQKKSLQEDVEADNHPMLNKKRDHRRQSKPKSKPAETERPIEVGDNVLLDGSGTPGTVQAIDGNTATVVFGMLKTSVKLSRLKRTLKQVPSGASKGANLINSVAASQQRERQLQFKPEIDVRGMRVDEAVQAITYFIDDATQFNASRVRILHGTGTGALRQYLRDYLSTVPSVADYRDEDVRFGGAGITVVTLK